MTYPPYYPYTSPPYYPYPPHQPPFQPMYPYPSRGDRVRIAAFIDFDRGLDSPISAHFARAPLIAIVDVVGRRVTNIEVHPNPVADQVGFGRGGGPRWGGGGGHGYGQRIVQWILSQGVNIVVVGGIGPGAASNLQQMGIQIIQVPPGTPLRDVLAKLGFL